MTKLLLNGSYKRCLHCTALGALPHLRPPIAFASVCHGERGFPDIRQKQEVAALAPAFGTLQRLHLLTGYRFESLDSEIGGHQQIWPCCDAGVDASGLSKTP